MKKDCMFQYATKYKVLEDTDLITIDEAIKLFNDSKELFKKHLVNEDEPEMAIWINCKSSSSYGDTLHHWSSCEFKVIEGNLYKLEMM